MDKDFFSKKKGLYFLLAIVFTILFGFLKGWSYTIEFVSILCGLFIPLFIVVEINKMGFHLYNKTKIPISRILLFLFLTIITVIVYLFLLEANQAKMLLTISGIFSLLLLLILVVVTYRR